VAAQLVASGVVLSSTELVRSPVNVGSLAASPYAFIVYFLLIRLQVTTT
jgi:hypothetical protein